MHKDRPERLVAPRPSGAEDACALQSAALEAAANPILISKRDGTIIWVNAAFEALSGYSKEEAVGKSANLLKSGQHPDSFYKTMWDTILSGQRWQGELFNRRKDGSFYQEEMTITPVRAQTGEITHFIAIKLDITERKGAEERISRLAQVVENSAELIATGDSEGCINFANHGLLEATGFEEHEIIGQYFGSVLVSANNPPNLSREIRLNTISGEGWRGECQGRRKDGTEFPIYLSTGQIRNSQGLVIGTFEIAQNITDRKRQDNLRQALFDIAVAADQVQTLEELYKRVHEIINTVVPADSFYIALYDEKNSELNFPYYVDMVDIPLNKRRSGRGRTDYVLRTGTAVLLDSSAELVLRQRGEIVTSGKPTAVWLGVPLKIDEKAIGVMAVQHYTNPKTYDQSHLQMLENISSHVAKVIGRKHAEEEKIRAEARFYKAFHASPIGMSIATLTDGIFLDVNEALTRVSGYEFAELIGKGSIILYADPEDRARMVALLRDGQPVRDFHCELRTKSGVKRSVQVAAERLEVQDTECVLVLVRDTTEQEILERQLRQSQRMEAVGNLAAGVAHDFNNLLGIILGYSELLTDRNISDEIHQQRLEAVRNAVESATVLTRQLLAFSRKQILQPVILDLNLAVQQLNTMLRHLIGENIEVTLALEPELDSVKADPGQMEQVLMNLVVNARDAMPHGGRLSIQTANVSLNPEFVKSHLGSKVGAFVKLSVTDTGTGMDKEVLAHLFEPFFTTKEVGKGTGLGLATVFGIVKQSEGYIWVESELGQGTTFEIYLPREVRKPVVEGPKKPAAFSWGSETILLVEDEHALREITQEQLETLGYRVLAAEDSQQAMALFAEHAETIALLLTDVVMPGMNGRVLGDRLRESKPDLPILFMSGYTDDEILRHGVSESNHELIAKPFSRESLASRIRKILDGNAGARRV